MYRLAHVGRDLGAIDSEIRRGFIGVLATQATSVLIMDRRDSLDVAVRSLNRRKPPPLSGLFKPIRLPGKRGDGMPPLFFSAALG